MYESTQEANTFWTLFAVFVASPNSTKKCAGSLFMRAHKVCYEAEAMKKEEERICIALEFNGYPHKLLQRLKEQVRGVNKGDSSGENKVD